ncbi:MAG TPA: hypothetical protein VF912_03745, partial [Anaeromyxobacter sp.]
MTTRSALLAAVLSLVPFLAACGGGGAVADAGSGDSGGSGGSGSGSGGSGGGASFRGDGSAMPSWGGWAWGGTPADEIARAGFEWFETGYPGDTHTNDVLTAARVRPFAYVNLGELHDDLRGAAAYDGPILRTNGDWGTFLVDVTNQSWQDWLVRRADEAYRTGSRGIKWDV